MGRCAAARRRRRRCTSALADSRSPLLRERDPRQLGWRLWALHALRTAVAAAVSMAVASGLGLPNPYWSPITTIIVTQSSLVDSWPISRRRLLGTALGVLFGAAQVQWLPPGILSYAAAILLLGLICGLLRLHQSAYRFGGSPSPSSASCPTPLLSGDWPGSASSMSASASW